MNTDIGLLILRISSSALMLTHGWGKLMNFSTLASKFPDPIGFGSHVSLTFAVFAEVFCAIAIAAGFKTKWLAIPLAITMFVAAFVIHGADSFSQKEKALLFLATYITLFFTGAGKFSVDGLLGKK